MKDMSEILRLLKLEETMFLSDKEVCEIKARLANIDKAEKQGIKKNYLSNQTRIIRQIVNKAERREKNRLI